jgi:dTDP-4-amino-4,6-dideoxygalactose transaminase
MKKIPIFKPYFSNTKKILNRIHNVLISEKINYGKNVVSFEDKFSNFIGTNYALTFNSGTSALHSALELLNIKKGDEVISTPLTAEPTNIAITMTGAKVVWADVIKNNVLIDPNSIEKNITKKTKAIMVVHYSGLVANMKKIRSICKRYKLALIEDAAHSIGARYENCLIGSFNNFCCFSFQAIKHINTGDGGMLTFNNKNYLEKAKRMRFFGLSRELPRLKNNIKQLGYKYEMNQITASIGIEQMKDLKKVILTYKRNAKILINGLKKNKNIIICESSKNSDPSYWMLSILTNNKEKIQRELFKNGIQSGQVHKRNDIHLIYSKSKKKLKNLDSVYPRLLHLPCGWWLTKKDIFKIIKTINDI